MSPRNNKILVVQDWPNLKIGKMYKGIVKKIDINKQAKCINVTIENLDQTQLGRIHEINLPLPIRPSVNHKTCSFLLACGVDASTTNTKINLDNIISSIIGMRFKASDRSQQVDFEKMNTESITNDLKNRENKLSSNQANDPISCNNC